jgi:predicted 2-oxoglutarate/Fe(II)-dependent dioxygenase YbiX
MHRYTLLSAGDPLPRIVQRSPSNPNFVLDSAAGRYLVLCILGSTALPEARGALGAVHARADLFNDDFASFFAVSADPDDEGAQRLGNRVPGYRVFWDRDLRIARACGAAPVEGGGSGSLLPRWVLIDPTMRVIDVIPFRSDGSDAAHLIATLAALPPPDRFAGFPLGPPILFLQRIFEPDLCARLIAAYEADTRDISGFMREVDGKTVGMHDARHKVRRDFMLTEDALVRAVQDRIRRRVVPEIAKVHNFHVTRMERYLVGCYSAEDGGHFRPHRDNTTPGTAHRRFAVSINLNDDFEGGEVWFPEYSRQTFKAGTGGAVIFSCALLHAVSRVTDGRRYAFLPFLYDNAAALIRAQNAGSVVSADDGENGFQRTDNAGRAHP